MVSVSNGQIPAGGAREEGETSRIPSASPAAASWTARRSAHLRALIHLGALILGSKHVQRVQITSSKIEQQSSGTVRVLPSEFLQQSQESLHAHGRSRVSGNIRFEMCSYGPEGNVSSSLLRFWNKPADREMRGSQPPSCKGRTPPCKALKVLAVVRDLVRHKE